MTFVIFLLVGAGLLIAYRWWAARGHERATAARLRPTVSGVVSGAEPIELQGDGSRAVLMVHGFGDTPQTLRYLAAHLHAQGWGVRAPLLPGHGRTLREFARSRASDWLDLVRGELAVTRARYETVALIGLSMGGSLAVILAAEEPEVSSLVLLAPYLSMPTGIRRLARTHWVWTPFVPYIRGRGERSIYDPAERAQNLSYGLSTPRLLRELAHVVATARAAASRVTVPTLVVQSREDHRIPPDAAERAFALLGTNEKRIEWTESGGHIITVDYGRARVFEAATEWLWAHARSPRARAPASRPTPVA